MVHRGDRSTELLGRLATGDGVLVAGSLTARLQFRFAIRVVGWNLHGNIPIES
jgi:hypothetical protein